MMEGSADEAGDIFRQHCLTWRSEGMCVIAALYFFSLILHSPLCLGLNKLIKKLDRRANQVSTNCQAKPRVVSTPSDRAYPTGAPRWALSSDVREDTPPRESTPNLIMAARKTLEFSGGTCSSESESESEHYFL